MQHPLSDRAPRRARPSHRRVAAPPVRLAAGIVFAGCAVVLGVAHWLSPTAAGHGTHTQLGLPPCTWAEALGKPCMTCGMTTAFAHAARGHLLDSFRAQPFGCLLAIATAATAWATLHVAATGSMLASAASRLLGARLLWLVGASLLLAWAYKVLTWQN